MAEVPLHRLEEVAGSAAEAASLRRSRIPEVDFEPIPLLSIPPGFYEGVRGRCCENVVGSIVLPLGLAGPVRVCARNGGRTRCRRVRVPLATTEGALVASVSRGCRALREADEFLSSGSWRLDGTAVTHSICTSVAAPQGMTRAPVFRAASAADACAWASWTRLHAFRIRQVFDATSPGGHARLRDVEAVAVGREVHVRLTAATGAAMGMNMVTRGAEAVARLLCAADAGAAGAQRRLDLVAISGNACADKKGASALPLLRPGSRGHAVIAEAIIPSCVVASVLRSDIDALCALISAKCGAGTLVAGAPAGGSNAQAANVVAAVFCACGQDLGHVGSSSSAILRAEKATLVSESGSTDALRVFATLPSLEMGVVGGGTTLPPQAAAISILLGAEDQSRACGCASDGPPEPLSPDEMASLVAQHTAAAVLAGELSLLASLSVPGDLLRAHMSLNHRRPAE